MRGFSEDEMGEKLQFIVDFADIGEYMNQPVKHIRVVCSHDWHLQ